MGGKDKRESEENPGSERGRSNGVMLMQHVWDVWSGVLSLNQERGGGAEERKSARERVLVQRRN